MRERFGYWSGGVSSGDRVSQLVERAVGGIDIGEVVRHVAKGKAKRISMRYISAVLPYSVAEGSNK